MMMNCNYFSFPGTRHLQAGQENEDRITVRARGGITAAVLCDGAGSADFGAAAADLTGRVLARLLTEEFDALYESDPDLARSRAIREVEQALLDHSRAQGIEPRMLACTILAAAAAEDGRCLCLHLGDGIIFHRNREDPRLRVVSCPMTGLVPHSTYLTMNCDMSRYLRLYRFREPELSELLLLTDGAAEHLVRLKDARGWVYTQPTSDLARVHARLVRCGPRDDCSAVRITRTPNQSISRRNPDVLQ